MEWNGISTSETIFVYISASFIKPILLLVNGRVTLFHIHKWNNKTLVLRGLVNWIEKDIFDIVLWCVRFSFKDRKHDRPVSIFTTWGTESAYLSTYLSIAQRFWISQPLESRCVCMTPLWHYWEYGSSCWLWDPRPQWTLRLTPTSSATVMTSVLPLVNNGLIPAKLGRNNPLSTWRPRRRTKKWQDKYYSNATRQTLHNVKNEHLERHFQVDQPLHRFQCDHFFIQVIEANKNGLYCMVLTLSEKIDAEKNVHDKDIFAIPIPM